MAQILSEEEFAAIEPETNMMKKTVYDPEEMASIAAVEEDVLNDTGVFPEAKATYKILNKADGSFWENMKISYEYGNESSRIDIMAYDALLGKVEDSDVLLLDDELKRRMENDPVEGGNFLSNAMYQVSGMLPAMLKGAFEGLKVSIPTGITTALIPQTARIAPKAFQLTQTIGSASYWYRQGAGSIYKELAKENIDRSISVPISHIAGAMYGAVEFSQFDKFIPKSKEVMKKVVTKSVKQTVKKLVARYGVNWATEITEEGLQEVIKSLAEDIARNIAGTTSDPSYKIALTALIKGANAMKESAIPMLLLMAPKGAIESPIAIKESLKKKKELLKQLDTITTEDIELDTESEVPEGGSELEISEQKEEKLKDEPKGKEQESSLIEEDVVEEAQEPTQQELDEYANLEKEIENAKINLEKIKKEIETAVDSINKKQKQKDAKEYQEAIETLQEYETKRENLKNYNFKIRRYKGGLLKEEMSAIPKRFITSDPSAQTLDEVADSMNTDIDEVIKLLQEANITREDINAAKNARQTIKEIERRFKKPQVNLTEAQLVKKLIKERMKGERGGFRKGYEAAKEQIASDKDILKRRRSLIQAIRDNYGLSDKDLKKISKKDIRLMKDYEFRGYIANIDALAAKYAIKKQLVNEIQSQIQEKELAHTENLRKALNYPPISQMTVEQLNNFNEILEETRFADEFLSVRKLETVENTELGNVRTVREAKEVLAKKMGVDVETLDKIRVDWMDRFTYDTALARKNAFYKMLVDDTNKALLNAESQRLRVEKELDALVRAARASRKRSLTEKAVPSDKKVFEWLEVDAESKKQLQESMTKEELALAIYMKERYSEYRDYLVQHQALERYQENYMTHMRRVFLEAWKEDGIFYAFKEMFKQYKEEEATFKILDDDTQNILPLEKFFQFAMKRTGSLKPTQNVSRAFKAYTRAFYKKQALDTIMPSLDLYAHILEPKNTTKTGLKLNRDLTQFTKEWLNTKKGRYTSLGKLVSQGNPVDIFLRGSNAFLTILDLGLNVPLNLAISAGEQVTTYVPLGGKQYTKGIQRATTKKGKRVIEKYREIVGKSLVEDLRDTADTIGDKLSKYMFAVFHASTIKANEIFLLGSMTDQEYETETISQERLALIKRERGRYRHVEGSSSIIGSTSLGKTFTKYKAWALPGLNTIISNIDFVQKQIKQNGVEATLKTREAQELIRASIVSSVIFLAGKAVLGDDDRDDSFFQTILRKAYRDALTIIGALDPTTYTSVRLVDFIADLSIALKQIVTLETYKTKSGYKGWVKLQRTLTPVAIKQFAPKTKEKKVRIK